jgi:hypothetical protein
MNNIASSALRIILRWVCLLPSKDEISVVISNLIYGYNSWFKRNTDKEDRAELRDLKLLIKQLIIILLH